MLSCRVICCFVVIMQTHTIYHFTWCSSIFSTPSQILERYCTTLCVSVKIGETKNFKNISILICIFNRNVWCIVCLDTLEGTTITNCIQDLVWPSTNQWEWKHKCQKIAFFFYRTPRISLTTTPLLHDKSAVRY